MVTERGPISDTACFVLAGGVGRRLAPLTGSTPKPLLPFGGAHRLLDFTLSNVVNSDLDQAYVLTQHLKDDIGSYLHSHWAPSSRRRTRFVHQPVVTGKRYRGTADSVAQNLEIIPRESESILVLSADHVYRMDYRELVDRHVRSGVGVTLAVAPVEPESASEFGIVSTDTRWRITSFVEKPKHPPAPGPDGRLLASMGVYVFRRSVLAAVLEAFQGTRPELDFGRDILPYLVATQEAVACSTTERSLGSYWRDVGTFSSYYQTNMDLLRGTPPFDLAYPGWPIHASAAPTACETGACRPDCGPWAGSIVASPLAFRDCAIERSILTSGVTVGDGADILGSIVLPGAHIGEGAAIRNAIVDAYAVVPDGAEIGYESAADRRRFDVTGEGIVVVSAAHAPPVRTERWVGTRLSGPLVGSAASA